MNKYLILEEGDDCIIMRNASLATMKTIPYTAITQLTLKHAPERGGTGEKAWSDFIVIRADGAETVIPYDGVLTPDEDDVDALFGVIWGWVYDDAAPTATPTPTPTA